MPAELVILGAVEDDDGWLDVTVPIGRVMAVELPNTDMDGMPVGEPPVEESDPPRPPPLRDGLPISPVDEDGKFVLIDVVSGTGDAPEDMVALELGPEVVGLTV